MLHGPDGNSYPCWLSAKGTEVSGQTRAISAALPITAETAQQSWSSAQQAPPGA
jgi:hypothetical protein